MNQGPGIDYKRTCFKHPEVQKIYAEPTLDPLLYLHANIKANVMTSRITWWWTARTLGPNIPTRAYAKIPNTEPYVRPENPGILEIEGGTAFEIAQEKAEHEEATRLFREVIGVKQALIQQIISAIKPTFLQDLQNPVTGQINCTIPEISDYLYSNYVYFDMTFVLQFVVHLVLDLPTINSNFQCLFIFCLGIQNLYNSTVSDFNMYYIIYIFIDVLNISEHIETTFINIKIERRGASFLSSFVSGKSSVIPIQFIFHYLFNCNFLKALTDIRSI